MSNRLLSANTHKYSTILSTYTIDTRTHTVRVSKTKALNFGTCLQSQVPTFHFTIDYANLILYT